MHNAFDNDCWIKTRVLNLSDARVISLNAVVCFRSCLSGCWSVTVCMRRANRGYAWGMWDTLASVCCSQTCTSRPPSSSASFTKCCLLVSLMRTSTCSARLKHSPCTYDKSVIIYPNPYELLSSGEHTIRLFWSMLADKQFHVLVPQSKALEVWGSVFIMTGLLNNDIFIRIVVEIKMVEKYQNN